MAHAVHYLVVARAGRVPDCRDLAKRSHRAVLESNLEAVEDIRWQDAKMRYIGENLPASEVVCLKRRNSVVRSATAVGREEEESMAVAADSARCSADSADRNWAPP